VRAKSVQIQYADVNSEPVAEVLEQLNENLEGSAREAVELEESPDSQDERADERVDC
tara:strand:+ start:1717 stop:1887 length:171 start_codon:yes stop_codon:yes gene_type:complete